MKRVRSRTVVLPVLVVGLAAQFVVGASTVRAHAASECPTSPVAGALTPIFPTLSTGHDPTTGEAVEIPTFDGEGL